MAKKNANYYQCSNCGHRESKWSGQCPSCGEWNCMEQTAAPAGALSPGGIRSGGGTGFPGGQGRFTGPGTAGAAGSRPLRDVAVKEDIRLGSGIAELDRVLGGGIIRGSSVLLGGEPGIGKSTLMLQAAAAYARRGRVLYISGEEAPEQIRMRADRLGVESEGIFLHSAYLAEACADEILSLKPAVVIVDSIQTLMTGDSTSSPGSPNQVKLSVQLITEAARAVSASSFFIAHVTKEGAIAGPKQVEHLVDAVLYFDQSEHELRFLRATKNRFGSSDEIGLFSMDGDGLKEVRDPGSLFLSEMEGDVPPGTAIVPVYEGSRILMVEIQALTVPGKAGFGRVYSDKIDQRRVSRVAAVIEKHLNISLSDQDIYVNVAGGLRLSDVGIELALAMAVYSARTGISLPAKASLCGEISLSGRVRQVPHLRKRSSQAADLGYSPIVEPTGKKGGDNERPGNGTAGGISRVSTLSEAVKILFGKKA